jgi:hypothetical protein
MHREERDQLSGCADCGCEVASLERAYAFGSTGVLCWDCAERRGGSYDSARETWAVAPGLDGLDVGSFGEG